MPWRCPICGTENPDEVDVCRICGAYRPTANTVSASDWRGARILPPYKRLIVEILDSSVKSLVGLSRQIDLTATGNIITIGRALDNHLVIPDPTVSRRHLRIIVSSDGLVIEDLGSTNGTYLLPEGKKINTAKVGEEASIKIGNSVIKLSLRK
ncbi:MAG: FHA domain-containing protein [Thermoproteus sp.]